MKLILKQLAGRLLLAADVSEMPIETRFGGQAVRYASNAPG